MEKAEKVLQTTLKNGQDKKSTTSKASSTFESRRKASAEQAGNQLFLGEETVEKSDKRQRRYIRIRDQTLCEKIDRIMEEEEYRKSFNKVINDKNREKYSADFIQALVLLYIIKAHKSNRYKVENSVSPKYEIDEYDLPSIEEVYEEI